MKAAVLMGRTRRSQLKLDKHLHLSVNMFPRMMLIRHGGQPCLSLLSYSTLLEPFLCCPSNYMRNVVSHHPWIRWRYRRRCTRCCLRWRASDKRVDDVFYQPAAASARHAQNITRVRLTYSCGPVKVVVIELAMYNRSGGNTETFSELSAVLHVVGGTVGPYCPYRVKAASCMQNNRALR